MSPPEARLLMTEIQSNDINQRFCSRRSPQNIASSRTPSAHKQPYRYSTHTLVSRRLLDEHGHKVTSLLVL
jgi:hypothetical protein